jgi:RNA polymerase sigma factor for flagellar operon FliA
MPGLRAYPDQDGLRGAGNLGLAQAAAHYQEQAGVPFRYFALIRIRGAILDELRANRFGGRRVLEDWLMLREATDTLRVELHREPSPTEVAGRLGWTVRKVTDAAQRFDRSRILGLDQLADDGYEPAAGDDPTRRHDDAETAALVQAAIGQLRPRLQLVVDAIFFAGQKHRQVAEAFGVTEARISQLYREALHELRRVLPPELTGKAA